MKIWATTRGKWFYWVKVSGQWICKRVNNSGEKHSEFLAGLGKTKDDAFINLLARNKDINVMVCILPIKKELA